MVPFSEGKAMKMTIRRIELAARYSETTFSILNSGKDTTAKIAAGTAFDTDCPAGKVPIQMNHGLTAPGTARFAVQPQMAERIIRHDSITIFRRYLCPFPANRGSHHFYPPIFCLPILHCNGSTMPLHSLDGCPNGRPHHNHLLLW